MNEIVIALIGAGASILVGLLAFLGVVVTNKNAKKEMIQNMEVSQAVTDTKLEELRREFNELKIEVREHNNFARRMPVVEYEIKHIEDDIHELQKFHK